MYHICPHTHPWLILSRFIILLIFHLTQPIWTYHHKLALWCGIPLYNAFVFHSVWEVTLIWVHIFVLFMLLSVLKSSYYHRKDKEWKISRRAQGRVDSSVLMFVTQNNSQVSKLLKTYILNLQMTYFKQLCAWSWDYLSSCSDWVCANVGSEGKAHEAEEATPALSEAPCPYLEA